MRIWACGVSTIFCMALRAQGCWPLVPPPPPPPNATKEQLGECPADEWAGHHQTTVLKGLFRDDLNSPPQGGTVILIRCFPAFRSPFQMELIQKAEGAWTLKGWFLDINLLGALADLKLKSPALSDAEAVEALRIRPVAIQVDPRERRWRWLARLKPGVVPKLPEPSRRALMGR